LRVFLSQGKEATTTRAKGTLGGGDAAMRQKDREDMAKFSWWSNDITDIIESSWRYAGGFLDMGNVSPYIPALAAADASQLGCAVMTLDGVCHKFGDTSALFSMQSISKVINLMFALKTLGKEQVFAKVGIEPTGDPYNCIIKLETAGEKPFNPFINAGAITVASLLAENTHFDDIMAFCGKVFGGAVFVDEDIAAQEAQAGKRNRSMAYLMSSKGALGEDVEAYLNLYFRLCAVRVNAANLAHMGAVLAGGGRCPTSGEEIVPPWVIPITKAIMLTCGMYDGSGEFAVQVGLPAKSGIGGGIVAAANGMGIGTFGPALDKRGNSVGGIKFMSKLSEQLNLSVFA